MSGMNFKDLSIWKRSKDLAVMIYRITNTGEFTKDYGLRDQMRRSAVSISSNIAEGNDRESAKEFIRFLYIAKGSLAELQTQLEIAREIGYLEDAYYDNANEECNAISKMIGGLIKHLYNK